MPQSFIDIFSRRQLVKIKSQKDFFSGLMFMGVGVAFAWGATNYTVGTGARMGPGYFPLMLGIVMTVIGALMTFFALALRGRETFSTPLAISALILSTSTSSPTRNARS